MLLPSKIDYKLNLEVNIIRLYLRIYLEIYEDKTFLDRTFKNFVKQTDIFTLRFFINSKHWFK